MKDPQSIQELDKFIDELKSKLPAGFSMNFFITKRESNYLMGVWYLTTDQYKEQTRKNVTSEVRRLTGRVSKLA